MQKRSLKKALAVVLSAAIAFSTPAFGTMSVQAAASRKYVTLNTTFKTLKVGQKDYKLKLKNNTQGWKIKKVTTTDASVCKPYGKTKSYVLLKGKGAGKAKIRVNVTRKAAVKDKNGRKKSVTKTKTLRCTVRVIPKTADEPDEPDNPNTPGTTTSGAITVSSQSQLNQALKDSGVKSVQLETDKAAAFTIPSGDYSSIDLTVNAPNADVNNSGRFKSIKVMAIKDSTWFEHVAGNLFDVLAPKARFVIENMAKVAGMNFAGANASIKLDIKGSVDNINLNAPDTKAEVNVEAGSSVGQVSLASDAERSKVDMNVSGTVNSVGLSAPNADVSMEVAQTGTVQNMALASSAQNAKTNVSVNGTVGGMSLAANSADVSVTVNGTVNSVAVSGSLNVAISGSTQKAVSVSVSSNASVTASTTVSVEASASASITLLENAKGSTVRVTQTGAAVKVDNQTGEVIKATTADNKTVNVGSNNSTTIQTTPSGGSSGGSSSGNSGSFGGSDYKETWRVTFMDGDEQLSTQRVTSGEKAEKPADPSKEGYAFTRWYTSKDTQTDETAYNFDAAVTGTLTLYAGWQKTWQVVFMDGDEQLSVQRAVSGEKAVKPADPVKEGYIFTRWHTAKDTQTDETAFNFDTAVTQDLTLYAGWQKAYTVTFKAEEGIAVPDAVTVAEGGTVEQKDNPVWEGHDFAGWYVSEDADAEKFEFGVTKVNGNLTLTARWTLQKRTVTFDANGGTMTGAEGSTVQVTVNYGETAAAPAAEKDGHTFAGWYASKTPAEGEAAADLTKITEDKTVYAKWDIKSYTVTFVTDAEGVTEEPQTVKYNQSAKAPEKEPKKAANSADANKVFLGWYAADASEPYDFAAQKVTGNITLTAKWGDGSIRITDGTGELKAYTDLSSVVNEMGSLGSKIAIKLFGNVSVNESVNFTGEKEIELDLNGYTISGNVANSGSNLHGSILSIGKHTMLTGSVGMDGFAKTKLTIGDSSGNPGSIINTNGNGKVLFVNYNSEMVLNDGIKITYSEDAKGKNDGSQSAVVVSGDRRPKQDTRADAKNTVLTVNNAEITNGTYGINVWGCATANINGGKITSDTTADKDPNFAVGGNGTRNNTEDNSGTVINITGGTINGNAYNVGVYQPQGGTLNISGEPVITGMSAVDVRSGTVTIEGGTFSVNKEHYNSGSYQDVTTIGPCAMGYAVAVIERSDYYGNVTVKVNGGTFEAPVKMWQYTKNSSVETGQGDFELTVSKSAAFSEGNTPKSEDYGSDNSRYTITSPEGSIISVTTKKGQNTSSEEAASES